MGRITDQRIPASEPTGCCSCFDLAYWQPYFMIEASELKQRVFYSINPRKTSQLLSAISEKPDLYGPFWICSVLIFGAIISSSLISVVKRIFSDANRDQIDFNYEVIGYEFCIVYGFLFGFPAVATIVMKVLGTDSTFVKVVLTSARTCASTATPSASSRWPTWCSGSRPTGSEPPSWSCAG